MTSPSLRAALVEMWYKAYNQGMGVYNGTGDDGSQLDDVDKLHSLLASIVPEKDTYNGVNAERVAYGEGKNEVVDLINERMGK